ncbi:sulfotransferase 1E1-like [Haemaphysalis longicornis]
MDARAPRGPLYRYINGFRLNGYISPELFRSELEYKPAPEDVFIATYPKSGTIWLQHIGYLIFHDGVLPPSVLEFYKTMPFLEMFGAEYVVQMKRPGLIKTHLPYRLVPKIPEAKYVCVFRNPKDSCVSFFYHTKGSPAYDFAEGKFEDYFDLYLKGEVDFGDYFDHVLSWYNHGQSSRVLFMHYEDLKADPRTEILKLAAFLGNKYHRTLVEKTEVLDRVISFTSIEYMKTRTDVDIKTFLSEPLSSEEKACSGLRHFHETGKRYPKKTGFIRKGVVGGWKEHFTSEMNARMEAKIYDRLAGTDFIGVWKKHGIL